MRQRAAVRFYNLATKISHSSFSMQLSFLTKVECTFGGAGEDEYIVFEGATSEVKLPEAVSALIVIPFAFSFLVFIC